MNVLRTLINFNSYKCEHYWSMVKWINKSYYLCHLQKFGIMSIINYNWWHPPKKNCENHKLILLVLMSFIIGLGSIIIYLFSNCWLNYANFLIPFNQKLFKRIGEISFEYYKGRWLLGLWLFVVGFS